jgi:hypothetical protein
MRFSKEALDTDHQTTECMMNKLLVAVTAAGLIALAPTQQASAHVIYEDLITNPNVVITSSANSTTYSTPWLGFVQSNFGWFDAADADWGDSHAGAWTKFEITGSAAYIDLSVFRANPDDIPEELADVSTNDLRPAFTLYEGVLPHASHDEETAALPDQYPLQVGKEGAWNALGDTTMRNEAGEDGTILYLTHAGQGNTTASASLNQYFLAPGIYTVALGGTCDNPVTCSQVGGGPSFNPRAYGTSLTVTPVPLPAAIYLFGSGVIGLVGLARRKLSGAASAM